MLTNKVRKLFGLKEIQDNWKKVELKKPAGVQYDSLHFAFIDENNVIQKVVMGTSDKYHREIDHEVQLTSENEVVGKRGKTQKLTYAVIEKIRPNGVGFDYGSNLTFINWKNDVKFFYCYNGQYSQTEIEKFLLDKFQNPTPFETEELNLFLSDKKLKKQPIRSGDIFRLKLDNGEFAYGRVIANVEKFNAAEIPIHGDYQADFRGRSVFTTSLYNGTWIDWYKLITPNPYLKHVDLEMYGTTLSYTANSNIIVYNIAKIVDHAELSLDSFDVPMDLDTTYQYVPICHIFKWGACIITFAPNERIEQLGELSYPKNYHPEGASYQKAAEYFIKSNINGDPSFRLQTHGGDLRESIFKEKRDIISKVLGFDIESKNYDEFANKYGCMTKEQIIKFTQS